jgi:hypothetical protein
MTETVKDSPLPEMALTYSFTTTEKILRTVLATLAGTR